MSLVTFCDERFPCSGGVIQAAESVSGQRDQDGRYEAPSPAPAPRMILVVGPSVRPLQPPARRPTDGLHNPSASIAVRALAGGDSKNLLRVTDRTPDPRSKAAVARDPKPTSSPLAHQPAARQVEGSRVRAPRVPASTVEEVKTPAAEKTSPAAKGSPAEFDLDSRPIGSLTTNIQCQQGDLPQDVAQARLQAMRDRPYNELVDREWERLCYLWEAPALRHKPLYFEELNLERYGYCWPGLHVVQPALSGAQFFATFPLLPYKMWCEPPLECDYTLGQYRPGSPAPYQVQLPCWRPGAGAAEAGAVAGLILLIP